MTGVSDAYACLWPANWSGLASHPLLEAGAAGPSVDPDRQRGNDRVGACAKRRREDGAALVVEQPVAPAPGLDLGEQHGDIAALFDLCSHETDRRSDQAPVRAGQDLELQAGIPFVPLMAQPPSRGRVDFDG